MKSPVDGWTDARYRSFVISALRGAFRRFPNKFLVLKNAATGKKINKATGKEAMHYKCKKCRKQYTQKDVQVDHVSPIVDPLVGFTTWDDYIERLYCDTTNLQVLCKTCHTAKSKDERARRTKKNG